MKKKASGLNNTGVLSTLAVVVLIVVVLQGWDDNPIVAGAIVAGVIGLAVFWWSRFIRAKRRRNQ